MLNHMCFRETLKMVYEATSEEEETPTEEREKTSEGDTYSLFPECQQCHMHNVNTIEMKSERLNKFYEAVINEVLGEDVTHPSMMTPLAGMTILLDNSDNDENLVTAVAGSLINLARHDHGMTPNSFVSLKNSFFYMIKAIFSPRFTGMDHLKVEENGNGEVAIHGRKSWFTVSLDDIRPINSENVLDFLHRTLNRVVWSYMSPKQKKRYKSCHLYKALEIVKGHFAFCRKRKAAVDDEDEKE